MPFEDLEELHYIISIASKGVLSLTQAVITEEQLERIFSVSPRPTFQDAAKIYKEEIQKSQPIIERLIDLSLRINTTHQAKLVATVHFAARSFQKQHREIPSETDVLNRVMEWKQRRKPPYDRYEVAKTISNLACLRFISVKSSRDLTVAEEVFV